MYVMSTRIGCTLVDVCNKKNNLRVPYFYGFHIAHVVRFQGLFLLVHFDEQRVHSLCHLRAISYHHPTSLKLPMEHKFQHYCHQLDLGII